MKNRRRKTGWQLLCSVLLFLLLTVGTAFADITEAYLVIYDSAGKEQVTAKTAYGIKAKNGSVFVYSDPSSYQGDGYIYAYMAAGSTDVVTYLGKDEIGKDEISAVYQLDSDYDNKALFNLGSVGKGDEVSVLYWGENQYRYIQDAGKIKKVLQKGESAAVVEIDFGENAGTISHEYLALLLDNSGNAVGLISPGGDYNYIFSLSESGWLDGIFSDAKSGAVFGAIGALAGVIFLYLKKKKKETADGKQKNDSGSGDEGAHDSRSKPEKPVVDIPDDIDVPDHHGTPEPREKQDHNNRNNSSGGMPDGNNCRPGPPVIDPDSHGNSSSAGFSMRVVGVEGRIAGQSFRVRSGHDTVIGRDPDCDVRFPEDTKGVSRKHCRLFWSGDRLMFEDLQSSYGTYFNDKGRLKANVPIHVRPGDRIYLGSKKEIITIIKEN